MNIYEVSLIDTNKKFYVVAESAEQATSSAYACVLKDYPECTDCEFDTHIVGPTSWGDASYFLLPTKEGNMKLNTGDYIATGVDGEHWAIDQDIFERTYERVD